LARGRYDLAISGWFGGLDPDNSFAFACSSVPPSGSNFAYFCDPAMDAAQHAALETDDRSKRKAAYARIERIVQDKAPMDFLWWPQLIDAVNPDLRGFAPNPEIQTWNVWQWSI
jgi:peptide/nickel transport system substrate-binding protein